MRPIFVIYVAAGLVLFFAVVSMATDIGYAYLTHHTISILNPTGDDLERMQRVISEDLDSAAETFVLAVLQSIIIIYARKLNKQTHVA
jgi:hypothetical protein